MFLCEKHCVPLRLCWPPVPRTSRAPPPLRVLPVCPAVLFFVVVPVFPLSAAPARPACAPCSSPCYPCPAALRPLTRPSPLPFSFSQSTLPVRLPSLSELRCHSCVPPACSTPAPLRHRYPFPCAPPPLVFTLSLSLTASWLPCALCVWGGVYLRTGLWPCPRTVMAVGFLRTMSLGIFGRNTGRTTVRRLSDSLRCICTVELSRIDQPRRCCTEVIQSDQSPQSDQAWSPRVHTSLHLAGVPWLRRPPRPGVVNPSEQGARMSNGFNAAPPIHAESFAAM